MTIEIAAISDTHNKHKQIDLIHFQGADVLIHAGDATGRGQKGEIKKFLEWYGSIPAKLRLFVPGNHDIGFQDDPKFYKNMCKTHDIVCLIDEEYVYNGIKFYGMPWTPQFCDRAFNAQRDDMDFVVFKNGGIKTYPLIETFTNMIPDDTDVLISHGPCAEILDSFPREYWHKPTNKVRSIDQSVGCEKLAERVREIKPHLHFFGHIHHSYGEKHLDGTSYYNCASLDEMYYFSNDPHRVSYEK